MDEQTLGTLIGGGITLVVAISTTLVTTRLNTEVGLALHRRQKLEDALVVGQVRLVELANACRRLIMSWKPGGDPSERMLTDASVAASQFVGWAAESSAYLRRSPELLADTEKAAELANQISTLFGWTLAVRVDDWREFADEALVERFGHQESDQAFVVAVLNHTIESVRTLGCQLADELGKKPSKAL